MSVYRSIFSSWFSFIYIRALYVRLHFVFGLRNSFQNRDFIYQEMIWLLILSGMTTPIIAQSANKIRSDPSHRWPVVINIGDSLAINLYKDLIINCKAEQGKWMSAICCPSLLLYHYQQSSWQPDETYETILYPKRFEISLYGVISAEIQKQ